MAILDGLLVLGILGAIGWVIYGKLAQKNPKMRKMTEGIGFNFVDKVPFVPEKPDKFEQVYDEKRTMM